MMMLKMRESGLYKYGQGKPTFDETGKEVLWTFEDWLKNEHKVTDRHGRRLMRGVEFIHKLSAQNRTENAEIGPVEKPVLPSSEWQIRPLLNGLQLLKSTWRLGGIMKEGTDKDC